MMNGPIDPDVESEESIAVLNEFAGATGWSSVRVSAWSSLVAVWEVASILLHSTLSPDSIVNGLGANAQVPL